MSRPCESLDVSGTCGCCAVGKVGWPLVPAALDSDYLFLAVVLYFQYSCFSASTWADINSVQCDEVGMVWELIP